MGLGILVRVTFLQNGHHASYQVCGNGKEYVYVYWISDGGPAALPGRREQEEKGGNSSVSPNYAKS
jgi:hypothetical protein